MGEMVTFEIRPLLSFRKKIVQNTFLKKLNVLSLINFSGAGYSPGKRVLGIRVLGTDLQLCGFWRALVRNLLMFVDGFFNFLVGILVVALNEHWQRVGDMAARTVVVDTRER